MFSFILRKFYHKAVLFLFYVCICAHTRACMWRTIILQKFNINQSDPILFNIADLWDNLRKDMYTSGAQVRDVCIIISIAQKAVSAK